MKTEKYIETIVSARTNMSWMDASKLRAILTSVMDMARKEEREKAINAFKELCCDRKLLECHLCSFRCNIDKFKELLNK